MLLLALLLLLQGGVVLQLLGVLTDLYHSSGDCNSSSRRQVSVMWTCVSGNLADRPTSCLTISSRWVGWGPA